MSVPTQDERNGNMLNTIAGGNTTMMYDPNGPQSTTPDANGQYARLALLGGNGKVVPVSQISPTSAAILSLLPMPNRPTVSNYSSYNNYEAPQNTVQNNFRFGVRLDHSITDNQRVAIHYTTFNSDWGQTRVGGPLFTSATRSTEGGLNGTVNYDWTARPTLLFNFRAAVVHNPYQTGNALPSGFDNGIIKLNPAFQSILGNGAIPNIQEDFQAGGYYGQSPTNNITVSTTYDFAATGTKIAGRHIVKFGFETRRYYDNFQNFGGTNVTTFMGNPVAATTGDHGFGAASSIPNSMGSFLLGIDNWNTVSGPTTRAMDTNYNAAFIQDDFKVTPKLTVNIGLRWDRESPTSERHDKIYFWDSTAAPLFTTNPGWTWAGTLASAGLPANTPAPSWVTNGYPNGAIEMPNTPDFPSRTFQGVNSHQLAPRLGLAYQFDSKTVVRASGGLMYIPTTGDAGGYSSSNSSLPLGNAGNAGWHASNDGMRHFISTWANPFPLEGMVTSYTRNTLLANQQSSQDPGVTAFNQNMHMPREYTWTASIQRQLPQDFVLEAGYSGNRGLGLLAPDLISRYPKNLLTPAYGGTMTTSITSPNAGQTLANNITGPTQLLGLLEYAYPYYGPVNVLGSNLGSSFYNAMTIRLEHRMTHGLSFLLNYTYSRLLDDVGGPEASTGGGLTSGGLGAKRPQSVDTFASTWGISGNDQTHRLSMAYIYEIPVGHGRRFLASPGTFTQKLMDQVVGGWQFSGNSVYVSGAPISLDQSTTVNINNTIKDETTFGSWTSTNHNLSNPAYTGDGQVLLSPTTGVTSSTIGRFDSTKVTPAQAFTYGTLPSNLSAIRNPSFYQTDLSIMKNFYLHSESRYLQIRAEGQNAFNIRGFGTYNSRVGDPQFGLITSAGNNPRAIQLSARIIF